MAERWRWVEGYEGLYMVSDQGRVMSIPKSTRPDGAIMAQTQGRNGYMNVGLRKDGEKRRFDVHRLVATSFVPNPMGKPQVNHKDGDKTNNKSENLEWVTKFENMVHSVRVLGHFVPHETPRFTKRKLSDEQADYVRCSHKSQDELAHEMGVSQRVIWLIKQGKTYKEKRNVD